jgi:integrase
MTKGRVGEALGLEWDAVDFAGRTLTVRQALQRVGKKLELVEPKSERSRRTVHLPSATVTMLRRHRTQQRHDRLKAGGDWHQSNHVFTSTIGTPLDERNVRRAFKEVLKIAELPTMRIHDLRHSCATLLLAQNVHPKVVQEILGHSQISRWTRIPPSCLRSAARQRSRWTRF